MYIIQLPVIILHETPLKHQYHFHTNGWGTPKLQWMYNKMCRQLKLERKEKSRRYHNTLFQYTPGTPQ